MLNEVKQITFLIFFISCHITIPKVDMSRIFFFFLLSLIAVFNSNTLAQDKEVDYLNPETWLLAYFSPDLLLEEPHSLWYNNEFDSYDIDTDTFLKLSQKDLSEIEVLIVLGTWCPDSRREVPRFIKLFQLLGFDQGKLKMMGTDSYKKAPIDSCDDLNIEKVPTFIFYKEKTELGRIIEYPKESLEKDMLRIFKELE